MKRILKRVLCILAIVVIWLVVAGALYGIYSASYHEERAQVPVKAEIERAIQVKRLENKIVFARHMALGGAGGAALGAPMVICSSVEQFINLVPEDEKIFVVLEPVTNEDGTASNYSIKKVYWAFIENRAGIIVYEDEYSYSVDYDNYIIEKYTPEMIYFHFRNLGDTLAVVIIVGILLSAGGIVLTFLLVDVIEKS